MAKVRKRVLFEMSYYSDNKNAIKKPFKQLGLKWQGLPPTDDARRGRYVGDALSVFAQYTSEHADFTLEAADEAAIDEVLDMWAEHTALEEVTVGAPDADDDPGAPPSPADEAHQRDVAVWQFKKPSQRPGEPDALFQKRLATWEAQDPRGDG